MIGAILTLICAGAALVPVICFLSNLKRFVPPAASPGAAPSISVLIPARNEEANIQAALAAILASTDVTLQVIVLDDNSSDNTPQIVRQIAQADPRVQLHSAPPLPPGWSGKQRACHLLSTYASHDLLVFIDADVRLTPDALSRMAGFIHQSGADLASGVPRQITLTFSEKLLIPFIQFLLLGFLPIQNMRQSTSPAYGAGCGQIFIAKAQPYRASGGHQSIQSTLHDGLLLPRSFRKAGFKTDLFDATPIASCRMYPTNREVWPGLAKNAHEGLGSPKTIVPATVILLAGQVLPWLLVTGIIPLSPIFLSLAWVTALSGIIIRLIACRRFSQSILSALLHPIGVTLLLAIQWYALIRFLSGRPASWKGRSYNPGNP
jgi:hypothetical protein